MLLLIGLHEEKISINVMSHRWRQITLTEKLSRKNRLLKLALHKAEGPLEGFRNVITGCHECVFTAHVK